MLITFSGLDGAGKSTLIRGLESTLQKQCRTVTVLTMYDHVGLYAFVRFVHDRLRRSSRRASEQYGQIDHTTNGLHRLETAPVKYGWLMRTVLGVVRSTVVKQYVLFLDLPILLFYRLYLEKVKKHILVIDRYFYDSLADVADGHRWLYVRWFLRLVPTPRVPIFVDVSPEVAFARKDEYSVESMTKRRAIYQKIFGWVPTSVVLVNHDLDVTLRALELFVVERMVQR